jgi:uncharacterized protein (DUF1697 family)
MALFQHMKYLCLLRGINVSGQKLIKMTELQDMFENMGYTQVSYYIQSGNMVLSSGNSDLREMKLAIQKHILRRFGFDVSVFVYDEAMWFHIVSANPFAEAPYGDLSFMYVTLAEHPLSSEKQETLLQKCTAGEKFMIDGATLYLYYPNGYGKSKLSNNVIEAVFKTTTTTRNWKTTLELAKRIQTI